MRCNVVYWILGKVIYRPVVNYREWFRGVKPMTMQDQDFDYFLKNMDKLYKTHGQKFVAVKNQNFLSRSRLKKVFKVSLPWKL